MNYHRLLTHLFSIAAIAILPLHAFSQILDGENKVSIILSDQTSVTLFGAVKPLSDEKSKEFFYLPCNLRLAQKKDKTPQFLFLKYTTEEVASPTGINGAIMHMLMEMGLTPQQERELEQKLKAKVQGAILKGMADVEPDGDNSVRFISAVLSNNKMTRSVLLSGKAPVLPGGKIALAADLDKNGAQLLAATFEKTRSITDLSIACSYTYNVRLPAARGYIKEDWSKVDSMHLIDSAFYSKKTGDIDYGGKASSAIAGALIAGPIGAAIGWLAGGKDPEKHFSYDEMHDLYKYLGDQKIIELRFDENISDERVTKIRDAFFQHFLDNFTEKVGAAPPKIPGQREKLDMPDIRHGDSYKFRRELTEVIREKRVRVFNLNYALAVKRSFQLTENLASWYDGVKNNEKCVGVVLLNDPTFQYRDINVILDLDVEDMFGKELNFVNVDIRKKRSQEGTNDFNHQITFDRKLFTDSSNRVTVTYSKALDEDPEVYEYKVQWSLRGGNVYPTDTTWTKGRWQGITLAPPVKPFPVHFEADLDDLQTLDIRNVTLQTRYYKFGKEVETNFSLNAANKEGFVKKTLYMDNNAQGYAYRLIFHHKEKGAMATKWDASLNTEFVYAVIPEQLRNKEKEFIDKAIELAKGVSTVGDGREVTADKILSEYEGLIKSN